MNMKRLALNTLLSMGLKVKRYKNNWKLDPGDQTFEPDYEIGMEIKNFFLKIDPFYENMPDLPKELEIGAWKTGLENRRKNQINAYKNGSHADIAKLHEKMFYNELITGLWSYFYFSDNYRKLGMMNFSEDFKDYDTIYPDHSFLFTENPIPCWGHRNPAIEDNKLIKHTDIAHAVEAITVTNCVKLASNDSCTILEIGSGMGGSAERLHYSENIEKIILVDTPLNLVTAYYYSKRGLTNKSKISIASS